MADEEVIIAPEEVQASPEFMNFLGETPSTPAVKAPEAPAADVKPEVEAAVEAEKKPELEEKEEKTEPEAWKEYKEADLVATIEKGEQVTDDQIEFLKSKGYDVKIEEPAVEAKKEGEDEKPEIQEVPEELVEALSLVPALKDQKFETAQQAYEAAAEYIQQTQEAQGKLVEIFNKNPGLTKFITDLNSGVHLADSIKAHFPELFEVADLKPGDEGYEQYIEERAIKRLQRDQAIKDEQAAQVRKNENMEKSAKDAALIAQEFKMDAEQSKEYFGLLNNAVSQMANGYLSADFMRTYAKGLRYEKGIADAERMGEIKGTNKKITISKAKPRQEGDGLRRVKIHTPTAITEQVVYEDENAKKFADFMKR